MVLRIDASCGRAHFWSTWHIADMNKKHLLFLIVGATVLVGIGYLVFSTVSRPGGVNANKIMAAAQAYTHDLRQTGAPVPQSVTLQELIAKGFLKHDDVSGFDGIEVTVYLRGESLKTPSVLMRARLPNGKEWMVFTDGSVQASAP
jgi:hypothetical protein